ncbi:MAG: hypothetical protein JWN48_2867 [Myxococcaceae bacterium]|nr:hypothetical protein [Myxococcaceae bacterium]
MTGTMKSYRYLTLALGLVVAIGCAEEIEPEVGQLTAGVCQGDDSDPETDVSFRDTILPHMQNLQTGCTCHNPAGSGVAIDTTMFTVVNYASVRRGGANSHEKIVIAGDPCGSYLYQKLSNAPPSGSRMPIFGPYWSRTEMQQIHDWIAEGARDN